MDGLRKALIAFRRECAHFWRTAFQGSPNASKRVVVLRFEELEERAMPSGVSPDYTVFQPAGSASPYYYSSPVGLTPSQIRHAYGIDAISFNGVAGDGTGQTIAIIDAYDDPKFVNSTDANFVNSDLHKFDLALGIPDPPSFRKVSQTGSTTALPSQNTGWDGEIALDVEWAHALAPGANILLVEARSASYSDLIASAANYARQQPGVSVITMSFGGGEFSSETSLDGYFTTPSGHAGVTFIASTGDSGTPGGYPALSLNVLAVGGTSLYLGNGSNYSSESGWSGSGGGVSSYEPLPSYQQGYVGGSKRAIPDVSFDADPNTGVAVYDSVNNSASAPWWQVGGTSFSSPAWASLIAIANQGRAISGQASLDGPTGTLPKIYALPGSDFHDVTTGNNGYSAGPGYDLVTGRGSPIANLLIPDLVGIVSAPTITAISNQLVAPGASTGPIAFTVGDQGIAASALTVTATSSNTSVLPNSGIVLGGSGANRTITLVAPAGSQGTTTITVTVAASPTLRTSTSFTLSVDHAPVLPAIANVSISYGTTPAPIALHASDADPSNTLSYSVVLHDPLADRETQLGLISEDAYFNYRGQSEKYLLSANGSNAAGGGWYVLMPSGKLLAWNGSLATSPVVTTLPTSVYANPALLTSATGIPLVTAGANPLYDLKLKFGLATPATAFNLRGANEYYLHSSNNSSSVYGGWYVLTANNTLLAWNGSLDTSTLVADLTPYGNVYANPGLLTSAALPLAVGVSASINPSSGGTLTLIPMAGFDRSIQVTVNVSDSIVTTSRTFTFAVNDNVPAVPTISPITVGHNSTPLSFNLGATGSGTLTYSADVAGYNPLYNLKLQYGFNSAATGFNIRGANEWYLQSNNSSNPNGGGWYVLMPTGLLYAWDGYSLPTTLGRTPAVDLTPYGNIYADPALLYDAVQPAPIVLVNRGPLFDVQAQFGLTLAAVGFNYRGANEWYFLSTNGSNPGGLGYYVLFPNGDLKAFNIQDLNQTNLAATSAGSVLVNLAAYNVYANPSLLSSAQPTFVGDPIYAAKHQFGLTAAGVGFGIRGQNEWYFLSSNGSNPAGLGYYVLQQSSGNLYAFDIRDLNSNNLNYTYAGTPVATMGAAVYNNPALLYASTGQVLALTATIDAAGNVTLTPNVAFVGTVQVTVAISDSVERTTKTFLYTVTDAVPTLPTIATINASSAAGGATIASLNATDSNVGDRTLQFSATTRSLSDIRTTYGLTSADVGFNIRGASEKYFLSSNGSNAAGLSYYVLMPSGLLYAFNSQDLYQSNLNATLSQPPVVDLSLFGVYNNTSSLYMASTLYDFRAEFGLTTADVGLNIRGDGEKYFLSSNGSNAAGFGYYVLMPNGLLYAFNSQDLNQNNLNATLSQSPVADLSQFGVYANTSLLTNASTGPSLSTIFSNQSSGGTLQIGWSPSFIGSFLVTIYVSDGALETQRTFLVIVS